MNQDAPADDPNEVLKPTLPLDGATPEEKPLEPTVSLDEASPEEGGEPSDVQEQRETMRGILASLMVGILAVVIVTGVVLLANGGLVISELEAIAQLILTPLVALVGSVVGFYYGGQTAEAAQSTSGQRGTRSTGRKGTLPTGKKG